MRTLEKRVRIRQTGHVDLKLQGMGASVLLGPSITMRGADPVAFYKVLNSVGVMNF